jgi:sphingomyelin phosphodiesterase
MASTTAPRPAPARSTRAAVCGTLVMLAVMALGAVPAFGVTNVFVQNNTPFAFSASAQQGGAALRADAWQRGAAVIAPGRRELVVRFNRDSGITAGQTFFFTTTLIKDGGPPLLLRQQLRGSTVGSHLWQSLAGPGFADPWYEDRGTHAATWITGATAFRVLYRAYFTGTDDDVEYILQYAYPIEPSDAGTLNVLAYNIYMRPTFLFKNGQSIRARLLPPQLKGYDAIVFSEAFDDDARRDLLKALRADYPFATRILGRDGIVSQDGGVIIVSRWPIVAEDERRFGGVCAGTDCGADKGVVYAKIDKQGRPYHVFGSHTQAWPTAEGQAIRARQFGLIKAFIDSKKIPPDEPVLIAGDLNVDRVRYPAELDRMLRTLGAELPRIVGYGATNDPWTNTLAEQGRPAEYLDYVLWSKAHRRPADALNEARILRAAEEWKEYGWEFAMWDLSDHYPVRGRFRFEDQPPYPDFASHEPCTPMFYLAASSVPASLGGIWGDAGMTDRGRIVVRLRPTAPGSLVYQVSTVERVTVTGRRADVTVSAEGQSFALKPGWPYEKAIYFMSPADRQVGVLAQQAPSEAPPASRLGGEPPRTLDALVRGGIVRDPPRRTLQAPGVLDRLLNVYTMALPNGVKLQVFIQCDASVTPTVHRLRYLRTAADGSTLTDVMLWRSQDPPR